MVNIFAPVVTDGPTYVKVANFPGLYRHTRSGRYYAYKKLGGVRWGPPRPGMLLVEL